MTDIRDQFKAERLKAIQEYEKIGKDAYLPANAWGFDLSVIDNSELTPLVKSRYRRELISLLKTGIDPFDFEALQKYAESLTPAHQSRLRLALRLISSGKEQSVKEAATPDNLPLIQAIIMRLEAMRESVKVMPANETKNHIWLSPSQVQEITGSCTCDDLEGKRDWIILGLLLGAGLHRGELIKIKFDALQKQPTKSGKLRDMLQVTGYGAKDRLVPLSLLLAERLREWHKIVGDGYVARSIQNKKLGESISTVTVHQIIRKYGIKIGVPQLKTDDLRRTYAQLAFNSGLTPIQIKELMGHVRLSTTQRYLNLSVDLDDIAGDFVPLVG